MTEETDRPFFSVVIPVYNKEPHIARAIDSVLSQSFADFELIIVCDPSTDDSNAEVAKFTDSRIRVFHRDKPGPGGYAARNLGISEARAEWVAFLDADDEWYPEHLGQMKQLSNEFPDVCFMSCGWRACEVDGTVITDAHYRKCSEQRSHVIDLDEYLQLCIQGMRPVYTGVACVRNKSSIIKGLFPAESGAKRGGDLHAWLKTICRHGKLAWSNHIGTIYYRDSVNMVTKSAPSSFVLFGKESLSVLSKDLPSTTKKLLKIYMNNLLVASWRGNIVRGGRNFPLYRQISFDGRIGFQCFWFLISLFPDVILQTAYRVKKKC